MLAKIFGWIVRHYGAGEYIRKTEIRNLLQKTRQDEAELQRKSYVHEMSVLEERKDNERLLETEDLKAEILRLNGLMSISLKKVKRADEAYYTSLRALRKNRQLTGDVLEKLKELMALLGMLLGAMEGIERAINTEIVEIEYKP